MNAFPEIWGEEHRTDDPGFIRLRVKEDEYRAYQQSQTGEQVDPDATPFAMPKGEGE
jgi:hypothetical protein